VSRRTICCLRFAWNNERGWQVARSHRRVVLTDRYIMQKNLKVGDHLDALVPNFGMHVTPMDHRTFVMVGRFPLKPKNPTRRLIAQCGAMTLSDARDEARRWHALLREGVDPKSERTQRRAVMQQQQANSFAHVGEQFLTRHCKGLRHAVVYRRWVEKEFVKHFGPDRAISTITPSECAMLISGIAKRNGEAQAHNALSLLRRLFSWSLGTREFGLERSPCAELRPADLIGKLKARERVLSDGELRKVWNAAEIEGYPYGRLAQMLILTGCRLREISDLTWKEISLTERLITIPSTRMKSKADHIIPICDMALALLKSLPTYKRGDYVFSSSYGVTAFNSFGKGKLRLNAASGVGLTDQDGWVVHDLRRGMRTMLSSLRIADRVREQMIGHAAPGLHKVYDKFHYTDEKRAGFELYERKLASILNPTPPATVTDIATARKRRA
jgi:integrase